MEGYALIKVHSFFIDEIVELRDRENEMTDRNFKVLDRNKRLVTRN